jgi:hypothetical protein
MANCPAFAPERQCACLNLTPDLARVPLSAVAAACRAEGVKRQRGEPFTDVFGAELFRRAICDRDQAAWEAVSAQYQALLIGWARRHPTYRDARVDPADVAVRALGRFWVAVGPERFRRFPEFAAVLQYLKMCVHAVLLDEVRFQRGARTEPLGEGEIEGASVEDPAVREIEDWDLWRVTARVLPDQPSRLVVYLSYGVGMKPADIHRRYPQHYGGVADVYRVKRNAVDRLRRSPEMLSYLSAS